MTRFFAFGCSFTQYWRWPTWADALGREFDHYENWGRCGCGNSYIFYSLMECYQRHGLDHNDTVYIMWTNTSREDRYVRHDWLEGGNVYWLRDSCLGEDYVKRFACERGYLIRDLALISATKKLLDLWGCRHEFMSMVPLTKSNLHNGLGSNPAIMAHDDQDVIQLYADVLAHVKPSMFETVFAGDWASRPGIPDQHDAGRRDFHPTPMEHLEYLDRVLPGSISSHSREWMLQQEHAARDGKRPWAQSHRPTGRL